MALAACGGASTRSGAAPEEDGAGGSSSSSGTSATGTGAAAGSGGTSAMAGTPPWVVDLKLDRAFPWFVQPHDGRYHMLEPSEGSAVHVALEGSPLETTLSTHNHIEIVGVAQGVTFRARASRPLSLRVSVKSTLDADYFAARDAGNEWPTASTPVTTDWATFEVPFAELAPPEVRDPLAVPAFTIAFIVEERSGPAELWLEDVHFF